MKKLLWLGLTAAILFCRLYLGLAIEGQLAAAGLQAPAVAEEKDETLRKALLERGRQLFNQLDCASCHGVDGQNPKSKETDFRLKPHLTYADIFKTAQKRVKSGEADARALAHFIKQLTESSKPDKDPSP